MPDKKEHRDLADDILKDLENFDKKLGGDEPAKRSAAPAGPPIAVRVSEDKTKAYAKVQPPMESGADVTREAVIAELKKKGVVHGVDESAIDEIFEYGTYNVDVVVAKYTPPSDGTPAKIEYKFEVGDAKKTEMQEDEHGNVDHKALNLITSVEEGVLLAVKVAAVPGKEGTTVTGEMLPAVQGRDIPLPLGENVKGTDDGLGIVATLSGQPVVRDGKVSVSAVYNISGDVSYKTGNVDFNGTVVITGNVQSDFMVKATGNIEIHGNIDKALIEAGGDVKVRGGLYGAGEGKIIAKGSVWIRSVDMGTVEAGESINIGQQARMSTLMAGDSIILKNSKGSIVGGKVTAANEIDVSNLGSPSFTETMVEVGMNPKLKQAHDELDKRLQEHKDQFEKISLHIKTIKTYEKQRGSMTDKEKEVMKKLVPAYHKFKAAIEADNAKLFYLQDRMKQMLRGKAKVYGVTYTGVKFYTLNASMAIKKEINHSSFYEQNEQIVVGPY